MLPKIRNLDDFIIADLGDELIVYDVTQEKRHTLNSVAAFIFGLCDGKTTPDEMASRLWQEMKIPHTRKVTWMVLDQLDNAHLLTERLIHPRGLQVTATCRMS